MKKRMLPIFFLWILAGFSGCAASSPVEFDPEPHLDYCVAQAAKTLAGLGDTALMPREIPCGESDWRCDPVRGWTGGFWPGILWYLYEYTRDDHWRREAERFTAQLEVVTLRPVVSHDLGFLLMTSYGNGYRLTRNPGYREILLRGADSLASLYNPAVGTILSWPSRKDTWPHNTIIDNMMNLELLFRAAAAGGGDTLVRIAAAHAKTTLANHFREDHSAYHVVVYDPVEGRPLQRITYQGYADHSMWARGQAWAIYGYTMCYRETGDLLFLDFAQKAAEPFLDRLPADHIPYWDFDDPDIPDAPRDASAAAIAASALIELSGYVQHPRQSKYYFRRAMDMLRALSSEEYQSRDRNPAFLLHSTGNQNRNREVDASIVYADYYYLEALLRYYRKLHGFFS